MTLTAPTSTKLNVDDDIRDTLISIIDNVRSCDAGDGDERSWEECARDSETLARDALGRLTAPTLTWDIVEKLLPSYQDFQKQLMRNDTDYPDDYEWLRDEMKRKCEEKQDD